MASKLWNSGKNLTFLEGVFYAPPSLGSEVQPNCLVAVVEGEKE